MTTHTHILQEPATSRRSLRRIISASLAAIVTASATNMGLYYSAGILFPTVTSWPGTGPSQIVGATFLYLFVGTIAYAAIARYSARLPAY